MIRVHTRLASWSRPAGICMLFGILLLVGWPAVTIDAADRVEPAGPSSDARVPLDVLPQSEWQRIDRAIERGLEYVAKGQRRDGSFDAPSRGQPGITSICVLAFLSRGYVPDQGPYGRQISRAVDYVLASQQSNGLISTGGYRPNYHHAISGLMLAEVYGMSPSRQSARIRKAIPRALDYSRMRQTRRKRHPRDRGGWRYHTPYGPNDSDMTATTWQLMFYRSAKNAEFDVPQQYVDEAMGFVRRCFDPEERAFVYTLAPTGERYASGAVVGGAIVSLSLGGEHGSEMAKAGAEWILAHPFDRYNRRRHPDDRYHYSAFYCSQAMFQLGGDHWARFYPGLARTLLENQHSNGSWDPESVWDGRYGNAYTTSLCVLALTPPYQLLPIYQR